LEQYLKNIFAEAFLPKTITHMKTIEKRLAACAVLAGIVCFFACNKDNSAGSTNSGIPNGQSKVSVYLMDDPAEYYKVLIDIRQVVVEIDTATSQNSADVPNQWDFNYCGWGRGPSNKSIIWDTLNITPGIYDLLELRNGTDTLLASGTYPTGKILKVQITLGSDNTIYTDSSTSYPLEVFGPEPYFDINVSRDNVDSIDNKNFELWLDFNLTRSIFFWSGTFYLKPYIVAFNDNTTGKIRGFVLPLGASPLVEAFNATDTVYAVPNWNGMYEVRGVNPGTYSLTLWGHDGFSDTTINNIVVNGGAPTQAPTITLHQ
jgi:hypothetical protein